MPDVTQPDLIQHCPTPAELDDLELLLAGALAPRHGFDGPGGGLTLDLPPAVAEAAARDGLELVDPEGLPLARLAPDGGLSALSRPEFGPFRRLYLTPAQAREQHAGRRVVPVTDAPGDEQVAALAADGRPVLLLALVGTGTPDLSAPALLRACLAVAAQLPDAAVVAVPLAAHPAAPDSTSSCAPPSSRRTPATTRWSSSARRPRSAARSHGSCWATGPTAPTRVWCCCSPGCRAPGSRRWPGP